MSQVPTRPAVPGADPETVVDSRPPGDPAGRRTAPRHPALPGARAEVRPWGGGPVPDVAVELLDVSELGVRVRFRLPAQVSQRFEVTLRDAGGNRLARVMATLSWSAPAADGTFLAGLVLGRPLLPDVVRRLAGPPLIPTRTP